MSVRLDMLECNIGNGRHTKGNTSTGTTATVDLLSPVLVILHDLRGTIIQFLMHAGVNLLSAHIAQT